MALASASGRLSIARSRSKFSSSLPCAVSLPWPKSRPSGVSSMAPFAHGDGGGRGQRRGHALLPQPQRVEGCREAAVEPRRARPRGRRACRPRAGHRPRTASSSGRPGSRSRAPRRPRRRRREVRRRSAAVDQRQAERVGDLRAQVELPDAGRRPTTTSSAFAAVATPWPTSALSSVEVGVDRRRSPRPAPAPRAARCRARRARAARRRRRPALLDVSGQPVRADPELEALDRAPSPATRRRRRARGPSRRAPPAPREAAGHVVPFTWPSKPTRASVSSRSISLPCGMSAARLTVIGWPSPRAWPRRGQPPREPRIDEVRDRRGSR